jgi:uncharacterized protein with von Willebrand factor type A (vWA) domain
VQRLDGLPQYTAGEGAAGKLVANIMHFARVLRTAGLPIGPGKVLDAVRAVEAAGIQSRRDLYWTLHAVFVNRRSQRELFDQAFHVFWRNPQMLERMMAMLLPTIGGDEAGGAPEEAERLRRRLEEALALRGEGESDTQTGEEKIEIDAVMTFSDRELLQTMDFEEMSNQELAEANIRRWWCCATSPAR